jgi:hypothetical protein
MIGCNREEEIYFSRGENISRDMTNAQLVERGRRRTRLHSVST